MWTRDAGYHAFSLIASAALLAGCGSSQSPLNAIGVLPSLAQRSEAVVDPQTLPYHRTFRYTGGPKSFKVPAGVTTLVVVAHGAAGAGRYNGTAGRGGRIYAIIPVTPGERLKIYVGGEGSGAVGGFNGGGDGVTRSYTYYVSGYGGGGATDIRARGNRLTDRIVVAGGGGGQGGFNDHRNGLGGSGGGTIANAGSHGKGGETLYKRHKVYGSGGTGGTQDAGGIGGAAGYGGYGYGSGGGAGALGVGGVGGEGQFGSGGGAGGGYYGGGGGGGGGRDYGSHDGGGGGGGSSYVERSARKAESWKGWKTATADGLVVLGWSKKRD